MNDLVADWDSKKRECLWIESEVGEETEGVLGLEGWELLSACSMQERVTTHVELLSIEL